MPTKMSFALGLWLLFGFFANFPTATGLQCYVCFDYPGSETPCKGSPAVQCGSDSNTCLSEKIQVELPGRFINRTLKMCITADAPVCNKTYICESVNKSAVEAGGKLLECDVTCCQTDRCNGPHEDEPNPTIPEPDPQSELKHYIETFRALLDELEYIVDKEVEGHLSATEYKERTKEILNDFYAVITNEEEQKSNNAMDEMKPSAAEIMKKLETKRGQSKKKHAEAYQLLSEKMESLARLAAQKR